MIGREEFSELFARLLTSHVAEAMKDLQAGRLPKGGFFDSVAGTLWTACREDVECIDLDITDEARAVLGDVHVKRASVFAAYEREAKRTIVILATGEGGSVPDTVLDPGEAMTEIIRAKLIEHGLEPKRLDEMLGEQATALGNVFSAEAKAQIDREVAQFREEIDAKIDSIFKKGGDSP